MLPGGCDCVRCVWCCQEGVIVLGVFGAARRVDCVRCVWCCQEGVIVLGVFGAARMV